MTSDNRDERRGQAATDAMSQALATEAQARESIREQARLASNRLTQARAQARTIQETADARILRVHHRSRARIADAVARIEADGSSVDGESPEINFSRDVLATAVMRVAERLTTNDANGERGDHG